MKLGDLLEKVRSYYLDHLVQSIAEQHLLHRTGLEAEQAHVGGDGEALRDGRLDLPFRADIVLLDEDGMTEKTFSVETEGILDFEKVDFAWEESMDVHLGPFQWNWCELELGGLAFDPDWTPLRSWFMRWYHLPPEPAPEEGLMGVVHFVSDPEDHASGTWLAVDFGSARTEAFSELLEALRMLGARDLRIGVGLRETMRGKPS